MKTKFSRILGVGLTFAMLASLLVFALPVSAGTLSWSAFSPVPSSTSNVLEEGNITDLAVCDDGDTIYAGEGDTYLFKSTNGGVTWSTIIVNATDNNTNLVAVAPDDANTVAYADTSVSKVFVSTNGGTTWGSLGVPTESSGACDNITDIAMSAEKSGVHYIAVAGSRSGVADVWYYNTGAAAPAWKETNALAGFGDTTANTAVAVAFSPNFPSDQVLVTLVEDDADDIAFEMFSFNQKKWNADAGFSSYPVAVVEDDGITDLSAGSITLDPEYLGSDDTMRLAYVGLTIAGDADAVAYNGIYRLDNTTKKALKDGSAVKIHSVAYNGSTLVAGRYDSNVCYYSANPTATTPTVSTTRSLKRPGMSDNTKTVVAWAGDEVVAGTSGDSSAFAVSTNDGKSFNDISLIDTVSAALANMRDVAVAADGSKVYMATDDADGLSLWRYASAWQRVLAVPDKDTFIIRTAPDDADVVYVADYQDTIIYYSADGGAERWQQRTSRYSVEDLAVETDGDVVYAAVKDTNKVSKSTNAGFTWGTYKSTGLGGNINMIVSAGEDLVLVGGATGYVAYSTDGNSSWTKIGKQVGASGTEVSAIASGLASGDYIYAGLLTADKNLYRWQLGTSTSWYSIYSDTDTYKFYGMALQDGVLYASSANGTDSTTFRTLNPTAGVAPTWSTMTSTASFNLEPQGLATSSGKLWAINSEDNKLYSYSDTVVDVAPTLAGPSDGFVVKINPISGYTMDITATWAKPSSKVTEYQLRFAFDKSFDEVAKTITTASTSTTVSQVVGHSADAAFDLMPGETYFWKVRVKTPIYSPWSKVRVVVVEEAEVPIMPAPVVTVQPPQVTVEVPPAPAPVPAIPAYLLWTIIGIGAVLVIALIVLIVRTRRVV